MKSLPVHEIGISGIGDHNSISSGPDDGANGNLRRLFWNSMGHSTTTEAVNNFLSRLGVAATDPGITNAGNLNIGGHGNNGFLETGCGQHGTQDYRTNYLSDWNQYIWGPVFSPLSKKNFPILYIYSCHTGAGARGADFLYALAKVIGKPVAGRTGFLYSTSQKLWFEDGSVWQVATPETRPNPIEPPTPHFSEDSLDNFALDSDGARISPASVKSISITAAAAGPSLTSRTVRINNDAFPALFASLFGSEPLQLPGAPSALVTLQVEIVFDLADGHEERRSIKVFNDRLAVDQTTGFGYHVRPSLTALVAGM